MNTLNLNKGEIVSNFIVNAFMLPNACIDGGTLAEFKGAPLSVYVYLVRRTRGWGVDTRAISIAEFERSTGYKKMLLLLHCAYLKTRELLKLHANISRLLSTNCVMEFSTLKNRIKNLRSEKTTRKIAILSENQNPILSEKPHLLKTTSFKASLKQGVYSEDFEKFWESYPRCKRKSDKSGTFKTFDKYKSLVSTETLIKILNAQKE